MAGSSTALVLLRFHLGAGVRVAWRTLVPLAVGVTAASVIAGDPRVVMAAVAALLAPPEPSLGAALLLMAVCTATAAAAAPRLTTGMAGWMRHLPARGLEQRRAVTAGLALAMAPVTVLLTAAVAVSAEHPATVAARLAGLAPLTWCAALAAVRVDRAPARLAAVIGGVAAGVGTWASAAVAIPLLVFAEAGAGALRQRSRGRGKPGRRRLAASSPGPAGLWLRVTVRALGWRVAAAWAAAVPVLAPAALFLANNRLTAAQGGLTVRLVGVVAVVVVQAMLVEAVAKRRPPWPWARSLPWTSTRRTGLDAFVLGVVVLPVVALAGCLSPPVLLVLLGIVPYLSLRAAAAVRSVGGSPSLPLLSEGALVAAAVALLPALTLLSLVLAPLALRWAAAAERRQPVERWDELQHLAAGDSLSWSGP